MRIMKEVNFNKFRSILSDTTQYGDKILALFLDKKDYFGISKKAYNAVYEGFWDIYCKKPLTPDLHPKRLDGFL